MTEVTVSELCTSLSASVSPAAPDVADVLRSTGRRTFHAQPVATAELLRIYRRRGRMGRLSGVRGAEDFLAALEVTPDPHLLMVVENAGSRSAVVWLGADGRVVGAVTTRS